MQLPSNGMDKNGRYIDKNQHIKLLTLHEEDYYMNYLPNLLFHYITV